MTKILSRTRSGRVYHTAHRKVSNSQKGMDGTSSANTDFFSLSSRRVRTTGCPSRKVAQTLGCRMCLGKPCSSRTPCAYSGLAVDNSPIANPEDKTEATKTGDKEETLLKHVSFESKETVTPLNDDDESFCFDEISEAEILDAMNEINELEESMTAQGQEYSPDGVLPYTPL